MSQFSRFIAAVSGLLVSLAAGHAHAGLVGSYYANLTAGSVASAQSEVAGASGPTATFLANTLCFPSCGGTIGDGSNLASFLGGNATNISSNSISNLGSHVLVLTGSLIIPTSGTYMFSLGSDDGSELWIGGNVAVVNDGVHAFSYNTASLTLAAGTYAIEVLQFEDGGNTGLSVLENNTGLGGTSITSGSSVPEPAAWATIVVGLIALGATAARRPVR